jgi:hypothetical protein
MFKRKETQDRGSDREAPVVETQDLQKRNPESRAELKTGADITSLLQPQLQ